MAWVVQDEHDLWQRCLGGRRTVVDGYCNRLQHLTACPPGAWLGVQHRRQHPALPPDQACAVALMRRSTRTERATRPNLRPERNPVDMSTAGTMFLKLLLAQILEVEIDLARRILPPTPKRRSCPSRPILRAVPRH